MKAAGLRPRYSCIPGTFDSGNSLIVLQAHPTFHLDCDEVAVIPLKFSPRSKLVVKRIGYFMKILERIPQERIKPVVGDPLEAGCGCSAEEVIMGIDCHLILALAEMKEWVGGSRVVIKGRHHKFLRQAERGDFLQQWSARGSQPAIL